jgi:hypothetical protein
VHRRSGINAESPINPPRQNPTALLLAWNQGEPDALEALMPLVYEELHRLATHYMRGELRELRGSSSDD